MSSAARTKRGSSSGSFAATPEQQWREQSQLLRSKWEAAKARGIAAARRPRRSKRDADVAAWKRRGCQRAEDFGPMPPLEEAEAWEVEDRLVTVAQLTGSELSCQVFVQEWNKRSDYLAPHLIVDMWAVDFARVKDTMELLVEYVDLDMPDPRTGFTVMHLAAMHGAKDLLAMFYEYTEHPLRQDVRGRSPLHLYRFADGGLVDLLREANLIREELKDVGTDLRVADDDGTTLLHHAAAIGDRHACYFLAEKETRSYPHVPTDMRDKDRRTAWHFACMSSAKWEQKRPLLNMLALTLGADLDARDLEGDHTGHFLCGRGSECRVLALQYAHETLGADVLSANRAGTTLLHLAASLGDIALLRFGLQLGLDPQARSLRYGTVHDAAHRAFVEESREKGRAVPERKHYDFLSALNLVLHPGPSPATPTDSPNTQRRRLLVPELQRSAGSTAHMSSSDLWMEKKYKDGPSPNERAMIELAGADDPQDAHRRERRCRGNRTHRGATEARPAAPEPAPGASKKEAATVM